MTTRTRQPEQLNAVTMIARTTTNGRVEQVKVFVADGRVRVYAAERRDIVLRREAAITAARREAGVLVVDTAEGEQLRFRPAGCGCGSPLKSFRAPPA